jgi:hypothetical protein
MIILWALPDGYIYNPMQCERKQTKNITYACMGTINFAIDRHKQKPLYVHESCKSIADSLFHASS